MFEVNFKLHVCLLVLSFSLATSGFAQVLTDPTRPAEFQTALVIQELPEELVDWKVTAIRISAKDRTAIVNGDIVREGQTIGPATILEIQTTQVILDYDNRKVAVRLFSDVDMRKPATSTIKTESKTQ